MEKNFTKEDGLMHYGVIGMKWGVRRYQNPDGSLTQAGRLRYNVGNEAGQKKGLGERTKIRLHSIGRHVGGTVKAVGAAKGIGNKAGELLGYRARKRHSQITAETQEKLKKASKTVVGKRLHETREINAKHDVDYASRMHNQTLGRKILEQIVPINSWGTPVERLSGRQTTRGMRVLDELLTGGAIGGTALDVAYGVSNKRARRKSDTTKALRNVSDSYNYLHIKSKHHVRR